MPAPDELTTDEGKKLIRDVKKMGTPILVFSGGDPLKRSDIFDLVKYARSLGLRTGVIPAVTSLLTIDKLERLKAAGLDQVAFSLDAAEPSEHDAFRRVEGVYHRTLNAVQWARDVGLAVQINSLVNVHNSSQLDKLIGLIEGLDIVFWEIFFLVPMGRGKELPLLDAQKFEEQFEKIYALSKRVKFVIKVTEAPHYRRFYMEKELAAKSTNGHPVKNKLFGHRGEGGHPKRIGLAPQGVNSGKGFTFISYRGDICPSGFLPIPAGNVRKDDLSHVYRTAPIMRELRDTKLLKGKCGLCEYKDACGGSRARAYALTGDYLAEDTSCAYIPKPQPQNYLHEVTP